MAALCALLFLIAIGALTWWIYIKADLKLNGNRPYYPDMPYQYSTVPGYPYQGPCTNQNCMSYNQMVQPSSLMTYPYPNQAYPLPPQVLQAQCPTCSQWTVQPTTPIVSVPPVLPK